MDNCSCCEGVCIAGWVVAGVLALLLLFTLLTLVLLYVKYRGIKKPQKNGKAQDPHISNPINTQQVHSPWGTREEAMSEVREQSTGDRRAGDASNERETGTQERVEEKSEEQSQINQASVTNLKKVNFRDGERERVTHVVSTSYLIQSQGSNVQWSTAAGHHEFSGSGPSTRYDYRDSPEGWAHQRHRVQSPPKSESPQHIAQSPHDGTGDYVHMNSVAPSNMFFTPMASMSLNRLMEESTWEQHEEETFNNNENMATSTHFPADYEDPVPSQTVGITGMGDPNPLLGHKGPTIAPTISTGTATASNTYDNPKSVYKRYMNINVSSLSSMMPPVHTSDSHSVSHQDSQPLLEEQQITELAGIDEEDDDTREDGTGNERNPYVNIDGAFLPDQFISGRK